mmetsp:Transcript_7122/g.13147  ORF Transcript_7122/g.13147 Transcript_7122/m.13147 type:complete len:690 (-) Transcript_7122:181-2250(-)|eukprot:CAMPEP_0197517092 /NCGR_PEP_ID=MMETSP1318-20131121/2042_1 /TAXON_ID=552666 /ORGANISM="Partenskyella glossopodia, Strain RCC365" /LENGTH=689 /DNA_ID=CAMNT_0043066365 /DNA_START=227 /DNA_END=2296 /DNA_ORIENTATION=+
MQTLIPVLNKLQDVFSTMGTAPVELPQLVVIGSQSAGKSSVLENVVGRDFLPRGNTIVTRRPLVLQLINTNTGGAMIEPTNGGGSGDKKSYDRKIGAGQEWGEFLHQKGKRFYDFEEIKAEIDRETERLTGANKGVSDKPIYLKIFSPRVLSLSLVDLPGITKVPVGDQPANIEELIREMSLKFIKNPNSIIVAVSPANSDIANSESLKLAKEVDPHGNRTLGVLTKLDLMDRGTDAMDVLKGKVIPLRLGFIPVINRSQADINQRKKIQEAHKTEEAFFDSHPKYNQIKHRCGTKYLAARLNRLLLGHIKKVLPQLKAKIGTMIAETQELLDSYGIPLTGSVTNYGSLLLQLISKFSTNYINALGGRSPDVSLGELYGGARISYVFHQVFAKGLLNIQPFDRLTDRDIRTAIRNATGPRPSLFVPEVSFELLVKKQINRLEGPSLQCVDMVFDELQKVASQCEHLVPQLRRFPKLRDQLLDCVHELLQAQVKPTKQMISDLIAIELSYVNTNHPDFVGGSRAIHNFNKKVQRLRMEEKKRDPNSHVDLGTLLARDRKKNGKGGTTIGAAVSGLASSLGFGGNNNNAPKPSERELIETEIIKSLIASYFNIVRQNVTDNVPKSIMFFLVNYTKDRIQSSLVRALYKDENFKTLLSESESISEKRRQRTELLAVLRKSLDIVNEVRDFAF